MPTAQYVARAALVRSYPDEYRVYIKEERTKLLRTEPQFVHRTHDRARTRLVESHRKEYEYLYQHARSRGHARNANKKYPHPQDSWYTQSTPT